jgi:hypothetical protein
MATGVARRIRKRANETVSGSVAVARVCVSIGSRSLFVAGLVAAFELWIVGISGKGFLQRILHRVREV